MLLSYKVFSRAVAVLCAVGFSIPAVAQFETRAQRLLPNPGYGMVAGDFNRDGKLDIAAVGGSVAVLLGNGDGTFQKPVNYLQGGAGLAIVAADFNGDGIIDLAVPGYSTNSVQVLLGNGDGTFQTPVISNTSGFPSFLVVGDFNHDHKLDLAMVDYPYISVLLGNGDGTFQPPIDNTSFVGGHELAVGDFNNDHKPDVVVVGYNGGSSNFGILLGNGDGTLQNSITYSLTYPPGAVATADFNGDGNLDLTITPNFGGDVAVLMGNGDATFRPAVFYVAPVGGPIEIGDFDGDGKLDMVLSAGPPGGVDEFLGNGDGTFQPPLFYETGVGGLPVMGDFNRDGKLDVVLSNPQLGAITALNTGKLSFSPSAPVTFPVQLINTTSAPKTVVLSNIGTVPISISSLTWAGNFQVSNTCGGSIASGATCNINVSFAPKNAGNLHGMITLHDSASSKPQVILLSGKSTPLTLSPAQLNFGSQKVGTISPPQQVTVTNQGSTTVTFNFIDISGDERKDFSINSETCSVQLAAGASCTVTITFSPTATGLRKAFNYVTLVGIPYPTPVTLLGMGT